MRLQPRSTRSALPPRSCWHQESLSDILLYHVTIDGRNAEYVTGRESLPMLNGDSAGIELRDGGAFIAGSEIVVTDIEASNGVIHVIDTVMLPPS